MLSYAILKPLIQLGLRVFFRRIEVRHRKLLQTPGPLLIVANHPNTLMDPLVVAANRRDSVAFLAKSTFFKGAFMKWLMAQTNSIPIYRRQDADGTDPAAQVSPEELARRNEATFGRSYDYLDQGGTIMIFPEGTSVTERRLRPLKTGAARIALGAAARHDFKREVQILPVGINYFDPSRFRSDVLLNVAQPIQVTDYAALYARDPIAAADELTEEIRRRLEENLVITRDAAEDELVQQVERTFGEHLAPDDDETLYDNFELSRNLSEAIIYFEKHDPARLQEVREKLSEYLRELRALRLTDESLESGNKGERWLRGAKTALKLALGFPVYVYGVINNYLPYRIPSVVAQRATKEVEFVAPILMVTGMVTFSLAYAAQIALVQHFVQDWRLTMLYALSLPLTGFYALYYWNNLQDRRQRLRVLRLFRQQRPAIEKLLRQRASIMRLLANARAAYVAGNEL
ncbi:lysophospholipid acyltransferase family protein [Hymenobacter radiodurans]|uniref:lysophospholipid acyltransferase family protein n=1 Tax=Hymenobacter radiodurans TaxID=2496028 RepID=UPI0010584819|nr:lysophospholipid acyltransferase family protein [Hymenobacter radiodurans]